MSEVKSGRYNVACTRYFEAVHKLPIEYQAQAISHPNQFYEESQKVTNGDGKRKISGVFYSFYVQSKAVKCIRSSAVFVIFKFLTYNDIEYFLCISINVE